jgi:hypothetical protein
MNKEIRGESERAGGRVAGLANKNFYERKGGKKTKI